MSVTHPAIGTRQSMTSPGTLVGGPDGATCVPTTKLADITLPTASLSTIYLGGAKLADMERAGRVEENTYGSIALADAMFATVRAPWCPLMF